MWPSFFWGIVESVIEVKPSFDSSDPQRGTSDVYASMREFNDTSTWEQIIRVLEETNAEH
jgi:hypothetical protein